jgi:hypothetical protein
MPIITKEAAILTKERDLPLLRFLWRWKVLSTASLCRKFFSEASIHTGYKRLLKLERSGFIQSRTDPTATIHVWMLTQKGFQAIRHLLPPLKEEGYKSEHLIHDWLVSSVHLGELLIAKREHVGLVSEQELRRVEPDFFPAWIPKSTLHRPDGYTRVEAGNGSEGTAKTIALEVELSLKGTADYQAVAEFYAKQDVDQIVWVTPKLTMASRIERIVGSNERAAHSFVLIDDLLRDGSHAVIKIGKDEGTQLGATLHGNPMHGKDFGTELGTSLEQVPSPWLLNARKSPHRSSASLENSLRGIF